MDFLAITSYYNPFRGSLRKNNYDAFRRLLGTTLITVEWSPDENFDLGEEDADYLIQVGGGDLLWQKERLLNIGLEKAREIGVSAVAFLDCDIIFFDSDWVRRVMESLNAYPIIQCFKDVHYLPPVDPSGMSRESLFALDRTETLPSLAYGSLERGGLYRYSNAEMSKDSITELNGNPGMAIAMRLDENIHFRHYEGNLVGAGDLVLMAAASNQLEELFTVRPYSKPHQLHICAWKEKNFPESIEIGFADNQIAHLWHGEIKNRKYKERAEIIASLGYDPAKDLAGKDNAPLELQPQKTALRKSIASYLFDRQDF